MCVNRGRERGSRDGDRHIPVSLVHAMLQHTHTLVVGRMESPPTWSESPAMRGDAEGVPSWTGQSRQFL